jgi:hypothetical protein
MASKVWYRNNGQLEVDVFADSTAALRRAASIATDRIGSNLLFVGIEDDSGRMMPLGEFDDYVQGYRVRGLAKEPAVCPKYYVDVQPPRSVRKVVEDEWVRYAIENTRARADNRAMDAEAVFGPGRVRVTGVTTRVEAAVAG